MRHFAILFLIVFSGLIPLKAYAQKITVPQGYTLQTSPGVGSSETPDSVIDLGSNQNNQISTPPMPGQQLIIPWDICARSNAQARLCGQVFNFNKLEVKRAFPNDPVTAIFTMPQPYVPDHFFATCTGNYLFPNTVISAPDVSCRFRPCKDLTANICGRDFPIPGEVEMGKAVPLSWLTANDRMQTNLTFDAMCAVENGQQVYTVDMKGMFCSRLPCSSGTIRLCDTDITVPEGTDAGSVLDMTMPEPFLPETFRVQCLGSAGKAPIYQLVDHVNVSCALKPQ